MNCRGDEDIDAKRSRPSIGKPVMGHARKERVVLFVTDQRITSGPAAKRPHSKAEYMTAPERFADSQIPLAPRAPSIHDPSIRHLRKRGLPGETRPSPGGALFASGGGRSASCYAYSLIRGASPFLDLGGRVDEHFPHWGRVPGRAVCP